MIQEVSSTDRGHGNSWLELIPFLPSERVRRLDKTVNGNICLTNFRVLFYSKHQSHTISIPIYLIRRAEVSLVHLNLTTKIGTTFTCSFKNVCLCECWAALLSSLMEFPKELSLAFAASYRKALQDLGHSHPFLLPVKEHLQLQDSDNALDVALVLYEFERLEFSKDWKVTDVNSEFGICRSYPKYHIMPRDIKDNDIPSMATFRSHNRFPSVVWRSRKTGAVLLRCAQPCVGIMYSRNELDEHFVKSVLSNCRNDHKVKNRGEDPPRLLIIDARNYSAAQLNRLRGGGFEYVEYYEQSQIRFMDLPNLHSVRLSFERLTQLYESKPETNWYSALEKTLWLYYISQLIKSASEVAAALDAHCRPVMVHCTDGWDRTPQLTSLAKILLDPFYRTIQGFRILVEHEWLQFGHKFGDRCGHNSSSGPEERSPIFLQWLDCVRQVHRQFPAYFEFNELFLIKLAMHTYSGLFGTFLFNSERDRHVAQCSQQTCSLWAFLNPTRNWSLRNYLYEPKQEVIKPAWQVRSLELWDALYQNALLPCTVFNPPAANAATLEHRELNKNPATSNDFLPDNANSLPVSQPLEVTPLATASSGPPTGGRPVVQFGSSINALFEDSASSNELPRSQSLMALSTSCSLKVQSPVASVDNPATLHIDLISTTLTATDEKGKFDNRIDSGVIRGDAKLTLSASLTSLPDTARAVHAIDKRKKLSNSASNLSFNFGLDARHYKSETEADILCTSPLELLPVNNYPPVHPSSSRGNISSSVIAGGLRTYLSDQDLSSQKCSHNRSASDPPSAYRKIRLSSFVGDDLLLVDSLPLPVTDHNQTLQSAEVDGGPQWKDKSPLSEASSIWPDSSSTSSDSLASQRAVKPVETLAGSASVGASELTLVTGDNATLRVTDYRSSAEMTLAGNLRYFVQPTFSTSYLNLDNPLRGSSCSENGVSSLQETVNFTCDPSGEAGEMTRSSKFPNFFLSDERFDSHFHSGVLPRSQTVAGSGAKPYLLPIKTSSSLRFGSPPENLDLFLNDGSVFDSHDIKPLCSVWPSDLDGLPMRVDSVTLRLHEKQYQEEQLHQHQQSIISKLASEVETAKGAISSLKQEVARLQRLFESQARRNNNFGATSRDGPTFSSCETDACPNGDLNAVKPSFSLEEALSDAMNFSDNLNTMTDDDLIELTDDYRLRPMSARQMLRIVTRDVRSHSFSSDVSSFEVVDAKDAGPGLPSSVDSTTIVLPECGTCHLPFAATRPSHPCGDCGRLFCEVCLSFPLVYDGVSFHAGRSMGVCGSCYQHFNASNHEMLQRPQSPQKYATDPSAPLSQPDSIESTRIVESFPQTKAGPPLPNNGTLGLLAEVQEEFPSHPNIHYRYMNSDSRASHSQPVPRTYSTPDESPVKEGKINAYRCRTVGNCSSPSSGRSQNGIARA
uniref:phosphatidylinositol-3,5-bisphosphate 3-phosphatase n=1 Tax=Schistocephalus solidus TaxID=70667 RepID=A0A0X3PVE4_SCHSO